MAEQQPPAPPGKPQPPEKPLPSDCCGSGCTPCILEVYADAQEQYQKALQHWQQRFAAVLPPAD